jgi:uncharacterized membrane protein
MNFLKKYQQLFISVIFTLLLIGCRVMITGGFTFLFIPWNTFLAIVPLFFSYKLRNAQGRTAWLYAALWLLFLPNAMYIVTDLFHLRVRENVPYWFDLLILFSAAVNGLIAGFISLYNTECWLKDFLPGKSRHLFSFGIMLLCAYGIYLGRYERWNSWDVLAQPFALFADIANDIVHPLRNKHCWLLTFIFGAWMHLVYGFVKTGLMQAQQKRLP